MPAIIASLLCTFIIVYLISISATFCEAHYYRSLPFVREYRNTIAEDGPASSENLVVLGYDPVPAPSASKALNSHHLVALRPDYAFWNVANVIKSFFDKRIEGSRSSESDK